MTREEAIKYLKEMKDECNDTIHKVRYVTQEEVLEMAIKALEQNESAEEWYKLFVEKLEQEASEDLISRQAVIELINNSALNLGYENANNMMQDNILSLPSVQPKTKTGHWIGIDEEPHEDYECDRCGYVCSTFTANIEPYTEYKYCPNCGAKMVEPQEERDKE